MKPEIINAPYPSDCKVAIEEMTITYAQEPDNNDVERDKYDVQRLTISTENCPEKGEANGGYFYSLKTDRWAFDDTEELVSILEDFKKRLGV
jgi:hypothetical protein